MEINSRLNLKLAEISVFFHFEKKRLENLPPNWHNLDLTKIWQGWICLRGKIGSCGWSFRAIGQSWLHDSQWCVASQSYKGGLIWEWPLPYNDSTVPSFVDFGSSLPFERQVTGGNHKFSQMSLLTKDCSLAWIDSLGVKRKSFSHQ